MYWWDFEDQKCRWYKEKTLTPKRKEQECCECKGVIKIGESYLYIVGKWFDSRLIEYSFNAYKICLSCEKDWDEVLRIFHENGEEGAFIVYGLLGEAVRDAFDAGFLPKDHPLAKRWLPEFAEEMVETAEYFGDKKLQLPLPLE